MFRTMVALTVLFITGSAEAQYFGSPYYSSPPVYYGPSVCVPSVTYTPYQPPTRRIVLAPPTHIYIIGITERTRTKKPVKYGGEWRLVPIINGYAPRRKYKKYSDGSEKIWYDYSDRISYSKLGRKEEPADRGRAPEARTPEPDDRPAAPRSDWRSVEPRRTAPPARTRQVEPQPERRSLPPLRDVRPAPTTSVRPLQLVPVPRREPIDSQRRRPSDIEEPSRSVSPSYREDRTA